MKILFDNRPFGGRVWDKVAGALGPRFAYDSETTMIQGFEIPELVIGVAFNGQEVFFIRRQDLAEFWAVAGSSTVFMHTASFDLEATKKACGFDFSPMVDSGRILDVGILYRLLMLGKVGEVPYRYSLGTISSELLGVDLDKTQSIRCTFGEYLQDGVVNYPAIPSEHLEYAARDAIATFFAGEKLMDAVHQLTIRGDDPLLHLGNLGSLGNLAELCGPLSHHVQLRADIALRTIERLGVQIDQQAVQRLDEDLTAKMATAASVLEKYGYRAGEPGNRKKLEELIAQIASAQNVVLPRTATGQLSLKEDNLLALTNHEFVAAYLAFQEARKIKRTYVDAFRTAGERLHPRYNLLLVTGRTSSFSPSIQVLPRGGHVRECVTAAPGHVLICADYSVLELCTLAQVCYARFGESKMRELINGGKDLHRHTASEILGKPADQVSKDERQKAKAVNFGLPGGMGADGLVAYAASSYGVKLTHDEAEEWRNRLFEIYPELPKYLDAGDDLARLAATVAGVEKEPIFDDPEIAAKVLLRIAGGAGETTQGRTFSNEEMDWAWRIIPQLVTRPSKSLTEEIERKCGSRELQQAVKPRFTAVTLTGRIRANCSYTESKNTPFQGLAADGAKLALYGLVRSGFRVVAFVHDEFVVEVPEAGDLRPAAMEIERIMVASMQKVCPDVRISVESSAMRRWSKSHNVLTISAQAFAPG